jgi:hypothetical protein
MRDDLSDGGSLSWGWRGGMACGGAGAAQEKLQLVGVLSASPPHALADA